MPGAIFAAVVAAAVLALLAWVGWGLELDHERLRKELEDGPASDLTDAKP
jgi:hypothetical protein